VGYLIALEGVTDHALKTVVVKIIRGEIEDFSKTWAPTPPELATEVRKQMEITEREIRRENEPPKPALVYDNPDPPKPTPRLPIKEQMQIQMEREGRQLIKGNVCQGKHERNILERAFDGCPPGSQYIGALDAIYSPVQHNQAAE